jgi:hypothetical protein
MNLTPEQKEHAISLIRNGEKIQAVKYFQQTLSISLKDAHQLMEKLEEESSSIRGFTSTRSAERGFSKGKMAGIIALVLGISLLGVVAYLVYANNAFEQRAIPVQGTVIEYQQYESSDDDGGSTTMYTPVYEYMYNGQTYTHVSTLSSSGKSHEIGEAIDILVDPLNPTEILINTFWEKWLLSVVLGFVGLVFTIIGFGVFRKSVVD